MVKALCNLCESPMKVKLIPCGKTAFLEAECSECGNAVDLIITAKAKRDLLKSDKTIKL